LKFCRHKLQNLPQYTSWDHCIRLWRNSKHWAPQLLAIFSEHWLEAQLESTCLDIISRLMQGRRELIFCKCSKYKKQIPCFHLLPLVSLKSLAPVDHPSSYWILNHLLVAQSTGNCLSLEYCFFCGFSYNLTIPGSFLVCSFHNKKVWLVLLMQMSLRHKCSRSVLIPHNPVRSRKIWKEHARPFWSNWAMWRNNQTKNNTQRLRLMLFLAQLVVNLRKQTSLLSSCACCTSLLSWNHWKFR